MSGPLIIMESFDSKRDHSSYRFSGMVEEIAAYSTAEVLPALERVEAAVKAGCHAAGFISYEAATGLNPELATLPGGDLPLIWFGIFEKRLSVVPSSRMDGETAGSYRADDWRTSISQDEYAEEVKKVREYIAAGDTYQVNLTMRYRCAFGGDPLAFYRDLCRSQRAPFCAFLEVGRFRVLSASPELFFRFDDGTVTMRPMKGTATRGRWHEDDEEARRRLREDPKERAENLMIVDMLRNDLGMVSATGSVEVRSLFDIESLETVHQMTSTITSRLMPGTGIGGLLRALFPCGSVTGAPKRRTMEIIAELEKTPRGIYTGCIGFISPGGEAVFSVAIRTVVIDTAAGEAEMGIGSGVTYDSDAAREYAECLAKGRFALENQPEFELVETMLFEENAGYYLLERHLERLTRSAAYFGFRIDSGPMRRALAARSQPLAGRHKVRLLLSRRGTFNIYTEPLVADRQDTPLTVAFAEARVDSGAALLYHKTTYRPLYEAETAKRPDCADVIFLNERSEVTEGTFHNVVARVAGELITPPLECGLLPGVFREELLERGEVRERVITAEQLKSAEEIYLVNSVRKWRRVILA